MSQELYRWIFPDTIADKKSEDMIATTAGGYRYATAVGSDIAGFRADFILIDDPMQPDEAGSELAKQKLRDWYDGVVSQRLLDQRKGVVGLVMHRISPDDFSATLLEKGDFLHLSLPLVAEDEQEITGTDGRILLYRKPGEVLNPNRASAGDAQKIKRSTPSNVWDSQFQQRPLYGGGGLFAVERLTRWSGKSPYELIVHSWDIAATKDGDWTVGHSYGLTKNSVGDDVFDLIGITRVHVELPDVREMIVARNKLEKPALIVVDGNGIGLGVLQDLNQRGMRNVISSGHLTKANAKNAKQIRFYDALHRLYDGRVRFPATMPGLEIMFSECASFPDGKHDDHVDALSVVAGKFDRVVFLARQNIRCARV
jgi:phage terminase large subunit-like protein